MAVQVPSKSGDGKLITVGKADLDLSFFVAAASQAAAGGGLAKMVPVLFKVGAASTGYLKLLISAEQLAAGGDEEDGMTEVSGMTGMTAHLSDDQDLSGARAQRAARAHAAAACSSCMQTCCLCMLLMHARLLAAACAPQMAHASHPCRL